MKSWSRKKKLWVGFAVLVVSLPMIAIPLVSHLTITRVHLEKFREADRQILEVKDRILADLRLLQEKKPFESASAEREAEPFLRNYVSASGNGNADSAPEPVKRMRALMERYPGYLKQPEVRAKLLADPEFAALDTEWMDYLGGYDRWSTLKNPLAVERLKTVPELPGLARFAVAMTLPGPNVMDLRDWATLNVLKLAANGRAREGLDTYRKAAQLIHGTSSLIAVAVVSSMLKTEAKLAKEFDVRDWQPVPDEVSDAMVRTAWAWAGIVSMGWFGEIPKEFEPFMTEATGFCAGLSEMAIGLTAYDELLRPKFLFETDFSEPLRRSREFFLSHSRGCHLQALEVLVSPVPEGALFENGGRNLSSVLPEIGDESVKLDESSSRWLPPGRIPYVRRHAAMILMSVARPNALRHYQDLDETETK